MDRLLGKSDSHPYHSDNTKLSALNVLSKNCSRRRSNLFIIIIIIIIIRKKIRHGISCESSARQTIHMKCHALFSLKNKIKIKMSSAAVIFDALMVKRSGCLMDGPSNLSVALIAFSFYRIIILFVWSCVFSLVLNIKEFDLARWWSPRINAHSRL